MSLIRTAKQIIEDLGGLDQDTLFIGNLYSADDIRASLDGYVDTEDGDESVEKMSDKKVIEEFRTYYDDSEEEAYYGAIHDFARVVDANGEDGETEEG